MNDLDQQVDGMVARLAVHERRLQARERLSLSMRLQACEHRIMLRSTISGTSYDSDHISEAYESSPPPGAFEAGEPHDLGLAPLEQLLRPILNAIGLLESALDFDSGFAGVRDTSTMLSHEKDHELLVKWDGVAASTVARFAPHLGSARAVEAARRRLRLEERRAA